MWKMMTKIKKYCYKSLWLQGILRLWSIIHETRAYQDSDQPLARLGHIKIPIHHLQDICMSLLRLIICKTWTYRDKINHLQGFGHIKTDRSIIRTILGISRRQWIIASHWQIHTLISHSQDLGISIKTWSIIHKTWVCHRVLVWYLIHL